MEKSFNRDQFIFEKNNSITNDIINDIIYFYKQTKKYRLDQINIKTEKIQEDEPNNIISQIKEDVPGENAFSPESGIDYINYTAKFPENTKNELPGENAFPENIEFNNKIDDYNINEYIPSNLIMYNPQFTMVKKYLSKEIKKSLIKYVNNINSMFAAKSSTNNNQYYQVLLSGCINNISEFTINKYSINDINNNIAIKNNNRVITDFNKNRLKILCFIWFLNDYDGEIVFWNNYKIIPKAGKLIIFPASWCFPYQEVLKTKTEILNISGYVFNLHKMTYFK